MNKENKVAVAHLPGEVAYIEYMETDCIQEDSTTGDESCRTADVPSIQVVSVVHGYKYVLVLSHAWQQRRGEIITAS